MTPSYYFELLHSSLLIFVLFTSQNVIQYKRTALYWGALLGHSAVVEFLIAAKVDVNIKDSVSYTSSVIGLLDIKIM